MNCAENLLFGLLASENSRSSLQDAPAEIGGRANLGTLDF